MVDIIAVTYNHNENLKCFINSIKSQTNQNWRLFIIHDGLNKPLKDDLEKNNYLVKDKVIFFEHQTHTSLHGHLLRKYGLENFVSNEYVLITNADNYYVPVMINEVLKRNEDFIYFDCVHSHKNKLLHNGGHYGHLNSQLKKSQLDMGCVVIKSDLAKRIGFNHTSFAADWSYFEDVLRTKPTTHKIDKIMMVHN